MAIAIVDNRICSEAKATLSDFGFKILEIPSTKRLSPPIASHPDMLIFLHNNKIITEKRFANEEGRDFFSKLKSLAPHIEISLCEEEFEKDYPHDAILNALIIGEAILLRKKSISKSITDYAEKAGLQIIETNQGYPACTTLALGSNLAITADDGAKKALREYGADVFEIRNGDISLPPYEYGFIGGATGIYGKYAFFIGNPALHRDGEKIISACKKASLIPIPLCERNLTDLGRILFIEENIQNNA